MVSHSENGKIVAPLLSPEDQAHLQAFEALRDRLRFVARGVAEHYSLGAYLVGRPGTSKTVTVRETLEGLKSPWVICNSRMSAMGLWSILREHPEHCIVLDDLPVLYKDRAALQILQAALDGEPGKPRPVGYYTKDSRSQSFFFAGGIIGISNVPLQRDPMADALASRVDLLEHEPSDAMIGAFMRNLALKGWPELTTAECWDVVESVISVSRECDYRLDLRFVHKGWQTFRQCKAGKHFGRSWQEMLRCIMRRIVAADPDTLVGRAELKCAEQEIALELVKRFPDGKNRMVRDEEWTRLTGKAPDAFYRRIRELKRNGRL